MYVPFFVRHCQLFDITDKRCLFQWGEGALNCVICFKRQLENFPCHGKKMFFNVKNLLYVKDNENSNSCVYVASRYEK